MDHEYNCPHCQAVLNPHQTIMLVAAKGDSRILIGFHPEPGNYEFYLPDGVRIEDDSVWRFHCPVCQADLAMEGQNSFCVLDLRRQDHTDKLLFSRIAGEHATFLVHEDKLEEKHGEHVTKYDEFISNMKYLIV